MADVSRVTDLPAEGSRPGGSLHLGMGWFGDQPGGLNRYVAGLLDHLPTAGMGAEAIVVAEGPAGRPDVRVAASPRQPVLRRLAAVRRAFDEAVAARRPAVVASHFALYAWPARRQLARLPHVVHFHGPWADEGRREGRWRLSAMVRRGVERGVYKTGRRFVVLSDAFGRVLVERYGVPADRVTTVPGGIDLDRFAAAAGAGRAEARRRLEWPADRPVVLCVRRLVRRMGLEALVDAAAELRRSHPDVLVVIGGSGPLRGELEARVRSIGAAGNVRLAGFVSEDDLPWAYAAADVSVVPTDALEGFGLVAAESLAAGTPALVTPVGGLPEVVAGLGDGLVLDGTSAGAVAAGLGAALARPGSLPSAVECRAHAARFGWGPVCRRLVGVYAGAAS